MDKGKLFIDTHDFAVALMYTQPRILAMFAMLPMFNTALVPGMVRLGAAAAAGVIVAPTLAHSVHGDYTLVMILFVLAKEAFIGLALGFAFALPFWAFEGVGFLVDNQRGASIAATLNPLTGNDSSPLGIMFNQAFIVFFLISGGLLLLLGALYDSYRLWPVLEWTPTLRPETMPLLLAQLDRLVRLIMLYSAPVIVAMFLAEMGLALVSRFVPNLQVFFLAMPIKSALALLILILYAATLFDLGRHEIEAQSQIVPELERQWQARPK